MREKFSSVSNTLFCDGTGKSVAAWMGLLIKESILIREADNVI